MININFSKYIPKEDGYYIMRFTPTAGVHLVYYTMYLDGKQAFCLEEGDRVYYCDGSHWFSSRLEVLPCN